MSFNRRMDKETTAHSFYGTLLGKRAQGVDSHNMNVLEVNFISERTQSPKATNYMIPLIEHSAEGKA
jgi:hypothetical protein